MHFTKTLIDPDEFKEILGYKNVVDVRTFIGTYKALYNVTLTDKEVRDLAEVFDVKFPDTPVNNVPNYKIEEIVKNDKIEEKITKSLGIRKHKSRMVKAPRVTKIVHAPVSPYEKDDRLVTIDVLQKAIAYAIPSLQDEDEAREQAYHALNLFGYKNRIIDISLMRDDRDTFYMLEDAGILTSAKEDDVLYDGREWRTHYWIMRTNGIFKLAEKYDEKSNKTEAEETYENLSDDEWKHNDNYAMNAHEIISTFSTPDDKIIRDGEVIRTENSGIVRNNSGRVIRKS